MLNITKTTKIIAFAFMLAFIIPTTASAYKNDSWGDSYSDSGWDDYYGGSGSSYYYDTPSYDYSYDYTPDYSYDYGYEDTSYYGGGYDDYYTPSSYYSTPSYNNYSYPTYTTPTYNYSYPSYTSSYYSTPSTPSTSYSNSSSVANPVTTSNSTSAAANETKVTSNNTNANNASAVASSSNVNNNNLVNNNVNNVYVYTNPTGTAVVNNPAYQRLDGYCIITPSNPRTGQTVTATAYMTGGIGEYTYVWGGDLNSSATGVSTSFTSYTTGTKNITVTARSGQDVKTVNCTVTFQNEYHNNSLTAVCYPSIQNAGVNQTITWRVNPTGGNGNYTYGWSGSDNLYGNNSSVDRSYSYPGQKNATVTVYSNGQSVSATCYTNIASISSGSSVSGVYVQPQYIKQGTSVSGVYLNDLPATGISLTWMHYMIATMVIILAAVVTVISKNKARFTGVVDSE
ncbi:MAG: hypothetical protein V4686_01985 [Patescibacteria group bacterium]